MPRKARNMSASGVYHVIWRGIDKQQLFADDADCIKFLILLNFVQNDSFQVLAYCLMGNHVHLLVKTDKQSIDAMQYALKRLGIRYASYYNHRYQRLGPIFQGRYKSQPIESQSYFLRVLRYIHNNPVAAHITQQQADYAWSSYPDYFLGRSNSFCSVHIQYALQLHDLDWLKGWHTQAEKNVRGIMERDGRVNLYKTDEEVKKAVLQITGRSIEEISALPQERRSRVIRHLVREEGIHIAQLSRLSKITRGEIHRCVL